MPNKAASDISTRDSLDFGNGPLPAFQIWKIVRRLAGNLAIYLWR